jgi:hypothetical protein
MALQLMNGSRLDGEFDFQGREAGRTVLVRKPGFGRALMEDLKTVLASPELTQDGGLHSRGRVFFS